MTLISRLPPELWLAVLDILDDADLLSLAAVDAVWHEFIECHEQELYRHKAFRHRFTASLSLSLDAAKQSLERPPWLDSATDWKTF